MHPNDPIHVNGEFKVTLKDAQFIVIVWRLL